jgi:hypothetical protein
VFLPARERPGKTPWRRFYPVGRFCRFLEPAKHVLITISERRFLKCALGAGLLTLPKTLTEGLPKCKATLRFCGDLTVNPGAGSGDPRTAR